jgi:hypothetical protein
MRANDITTLALRLARGELVHPTVPSAASYLGASDLVYVPIPDMPALRSVLVWRRRGNDARVREFVDIARRVLDDAPADPAAAAREAATGSQGRPR